MAKGTGEGEQSNKLWQKFLMMEGPFFWAPKFDRAEIERLRKEYREKKKKAKSKEKAD